MVALAGDWFTVADRDGVNAAAPATVKAVVGFYGIYDMLAQWQQDMKVSPGDSITEDFLGVSPSRNRQLYLESSPIAYAASDRNQVRFLLIHGDRDNLVDPRSQSGAFTTALTKSGFIARLIMIPGAAHFWASNPFERDPHSYGAIAAPAILEFLDSSL
jgi:dipeptidyl aminopeptidase/acylaminoacyl peptidase